MRSPHSKQLSPPAVQVILEQLPERIKQALFDRPFEIDYPVEVVIEMALAGYLDPGAIGFADCNSQWGQVGWCGAQYAAINVPEYWLIDPVAQTVMLLSLEATAYREVGVFGKQDAIASAEFPELSLTAEQIFESDIQ